MTKKKSNWAFCWLESRHRRRSVGTFDAVGYVTVNVAISVYVMQFTIVHTRSCLTIVWHFVSHFMNQTSNVHLVCHGLHVHLASQWCWIQCILYLILSIVTRCFSRRPHRLQAFILQNDNASHNPLSRRNAALIKTKHTSEMIPHGLFYCWTIEMCQEFYIEVDVKILIAVKVKIRVHNSAGHERPRLPKRPSDVMHCVIFYKFLWTGNYLVVDPTNC